MCDKYRKNSSMNAGDNVILRGTESAAGEGEGGNGAPGKRRRGVRKRPLVRRRKPKRNCLLSNLLNFICQCMAIPNSKVKSYFFTYLIGKQTNKRVK